MIPVLGCLEKAENAEMVLNLSVYVPTSYILENKLHKYVDKPNNINHTG